MTKHDILKLTDFSGNEVDLLSGRHGYNLVEWNMGSAQDKNGGVFADPSGADGSYIVQRAKATIEDIMTFVPTSTSQNRLKRKMSAFVDILDRAVEAWLNPGSRYVYLMAKTSRMAQPEYAIVIWSSTHGMPNPFTSLYSGEDRSSLPPVDITIRRGPFRQSVYGAYNQLPMYAPDFTMLDTVSHTFIYNVISNADDGWIDSGWAASFNNSSTTLKLQYQDTGIASDLIDASIVLRFQHVVFLHEDYHSWTNIRMRGIADSVTTTAGVAVDYTDNSPAFTGYSNVTTRVWNTVPGTSIPLGPNTENVDTTIHGGTTGLSELALSVYNRSGWRNGNALSFWIMQTDYGSDFRKDWAAREHATYTEPRFYLNYLLPNNNSVANSPTETVLERAITHGGTFESSAVLTWVMDGDGIRDVTGQSGVIADSSISYLLTGTEGSLPVAIITKLASSVTNDFMPEYYDGVSSDWASDFGGIENQDMNNGYMRFESISATRIHAVGKQDLLSIMWGDVPSYGWPQLSKFWTRWVPTTVPSGGINLAEPIGGDFRGFADFYLPGDYPHYDISVSMNTSYSPVANVANFVFITDPTERPNFSPYISLAGEGLPTGVSLSSTYGPVKADSQFGLYGQVAVMTDNEQMNVHFNGSIAPQYNGDYDIYIRYNLEEDGGDDPSGGLWRVSSSFGSVALPYQLGTLGGMYLGRFSNSSRILPGAFSIELLFTREVAGYKLHLSDMVMIPVNSGSLAVFYSQPGSTKVVGRGIDPSGRIATTVGANIVSSGFKLRGGQDWRVWPWSIGLQASDASYGTRLTAATDNSVLSVSATGRRDTL